VEHYQPAHDGLVVRLYLEDPLRRTQGIGEFSIAQQGVDSHQRSTRDLQLEPSTLALEPALKPFATGSEQRREKLAVIPRECPIDLTFFQGGPNNSEIRLELSRIYGNFLIAARPNHIIAEGLA
jgi:hypothetical protein